MRKQKLHTLYMRRLKIGDIGWRDGSDAAELMEHGEKYGIYMRGFSGGYITSSNRKQGLKTLCAGGWKETKRFYKTHVLSPWKIPDGAINE